MLDPEVFYENEATIAEYLTEEELREMYG